MAKMIKTSDLLVEVAAKLLQDLNPDKIRFVKMGNSGFLRKVIMTDVKPKDLVYPEGWYYAKGCFSNKHTSTTGLYGEMLMIKGDGSFWEDTYCTLPSDYPDNN